MSTGSLYQTSLLDSFTVEWTNPCETPLNYFIPAQPTPVFSQALGSGLHTYQVDMQNYQASQLGDAAFCGDRNTSYHVSNIGVVDQISVSEMTGLAYFVISVGDPQGWT